MGIGAERPNREAGAMPARSRHCMEERVRLSHWETGKTERVLTPSQENCLFIIHHLTNERLEGESGSCFACRERGFFLRLKLDSSTKMVDESHYLGIIASGR